MHPFRSAVENREIESVPPMLAQDVVFLSPVVFKPYQGRELVAAILGGAFRVLEGLRYERKLASGDGRDHALMFRAQVGDREVQGCDFLRHDEAGLISEFCVMVRPLSAAHALAEAMALQFERIERELGGL